MKEKGYFWLLLAASLAGWSAFILVIVNVDPFTAAWYEFLFFYFSIGLALAGTLFLIGWWLRAKMIRRFRLENYHSDIWRQTLLLTILVIVMLLLRSIQMLFWWNIVIFVAFLGALEYFFIIYRRR